MRRWDPTFERECHRHVVRICDGGLPETERNEAWRAFLVAVAPHIEGWAGGSPVLRRCGLGAEDEVRAVLVAVLSRMSARGFENLRAYLAKQPPPPEDEQEAALVDGLARLARVADPDVDPAPRSDEVVELTPLRGWLLSLTRFAVKDHVKQRLGWTTSVRAVYGLGRRRGADGEALLQAVRAVPGVIAAELDEPAHELAVELLPGTARTERIEAAIEGAGHVIATRPDLRRSKRDLVTGAKRLDDVEEQGARPPITDALTLARLLAEVAAFVETFPAPMPEAVRLWLDDEPFEAIARQLGLEGPDKARALVRAGVARLRERFRGQWPMLAA